MPEYVKRDHSMGEHPEFNNITMDVTNPTVPYIVYESSMARSERHTRRLIVALVIAIVLIVASNMAWLWAWMQYDYTSEETVIQQDGEGININGNNNGVTHGAENYETETDADEEEWQLEGNT